MFHTLARSATVGLFALGAFLGASGIASADPPPSDEEYIPSPIGESESPPAVAPFTPGVLDQSKPKIQVVIPPVVQLPPEPQIDPRHLRPTIPSPWDNDPTS